MGPIKSMSVEKNPLRLPVGSFLLDTILFNGVIQ